MRILSSAHLWTSLSCINTRSLCVVLFDVGTFIKSIPMSNFEKFDKTVLVVDDHEMSVKLLRQILQDAGFAVVSAPSGEEALKLVQDFKPDLVLLDIILEGMNGYKTCQVLKIILPGTPIIFLSTVSNREKGLQLGAVDYITKPFQIQDVVRCVKQHLGLDTTAEP
jgi:two-component system, sensor histidine kinase and response regulator